jgi:hypothetical protein
MPPVHKDTARHYRRRSELRQLMLDAGVELLLAEGVVGARNVTLQKTFDLLLSQGADPVTKGSVLGPKRIWSTQREFQLDTLAHFVTAFASGGSEFDDTMLAVLPVLEFADLSTKRSRALVFREVIRVGGEANVRAMNGRRDWAIWLAIWGAFGSAADPDEFATVASAISEADRRIAADLIAFVVEPLAELFKLHVRPDFEPDGVARFATALTALADGFVLRAGAGGVDTSPIVRTNPVTGEQEPWHPFSVGMEALIHQYFEMR